MPVPNKYANNIVTKPINGIKQDTISMVDPRIMIAKGFLDLLKIKCPSKYPANGPLIIIIMIHTNIANIASGIPMNEISNKNINTGAKIIAPAPMSAVWIGVFVALVAVSWSVRGNKATNTTDKTIVVINRYTNPKAANAIGEYETVFLSCFNSVRVTLPIIFPPLLTSGSLSPA